MNDTIVIFGANGFLGRYLCRHFARSGKEVVAIARSREAWSGDGMFLEWDGKNLGPWALSLEGAKAVINLAGRSVDCRYHPANRAAILASRVATTRLIGKAIAACKVAPELWLNASTATWYRDAQDRPQDEWRGEPGEGFSCEVARAWEHEFYSAAVPGLTRKIAMRTGMVIANEPGTVFDKLRKLTKWGLGGAMAGGNQRVSWIHMEDFLRAVDFAISENRLEGNVNFSAPESPTQRQWARGFREMVGMPVGLPSTRWMLRWGAALLSTEAELVTKSRWVRPLQLADAGFQWRWNNAADAIVDLDQRRGLESFFRPARTRSIGARGWLPETIR